jgi:putative Holliday junction resolvase
MSTDPNAQALGVDYGNKRIGLAITSLFTKLPRPYKTLENDGSSLEKIQEIIELENIKFVIIGLPRNLSGKATEQTKLASEYIDMLKSLTDAPVIVKDEALTSVLAEQELDGLSKDYKKSDVDSLAATYILEDWLKEDYKD